MFKRFKIPKKILSGLLATTLIVTSIPAYAAGGGHGETGGSGSTGGGSSNVAVSYSSGTTGTKVSIIKVPVNGQDSYDLGYMFNKTAMGKEAGYTGEPTEVLGSAPIYFMSKDGTSLEGYSLRDGSGNYKTKSFSEYIVKNDPSIYNADQEVFNRIMRSLKVDWFNSVPDIIHGSNYLNILPDMSKADEATKTRVVNILKTLANIVKTEYAGELSGGLNEAINQMAETGACITQDGNFEYMFLIEPITGMKPSGQSAFGMTPNQFCSMYFDSHGKDITILENMEDTRAYINDTPKKRSGSGFNDQINFQLGMYSGTRLSDYWNTNGAQSIASKIFYTGPKITTSGNTEYATREAKKYGWGIIKPSDLVQSTSSKEVYYGVMYPELGTSGVSKYSVNGTAANVIKNKSLSTLNLMSKKLDVSSAANTLNAVFSLSAIQTYEHNNTAVKGDKSALVFASLARSNGAELTTLSLPDKQSIGISNTLPKLGLDSVIEKVNKDIISVTMNEPLSDLYNIDVESVAGYIEGNISYIGDGTKVPGITASILDEALSETNLSLKDQLKQDGKSKNGNILVVTRTDSALAYGEGTAGKFSYRKLNNIAIGAELQQNFNNILKNDIPVTVYKQKTETQIKPSQYMHGLYGILKVNTNLLQNGKLTTLAGLVNLASSGSKMSDLCNILIASGISDLNNEVFINNKGTTFLNKKGSASLRIAIADEGVPINLEVVFKDKDGKYKLAKFKNGDTTLPLGVAIPKSVVSNMSISEKIQIGDTELDVTKVTVRSSRTKTGEFADALIKNLEANNTTTQNFNSSGSFDVPIMALDDDREIQLAPRREDFGNGIALVVIADTVDTQPEVIKVYEDENNKHEKTTVDVPNTATYKVINEGNYKVTEWFTSTEKPVDLTGRTSWEDLNSVLRPLNSPKGTNETLLEFSKLPKPTYVYIRYVKNDTTVTQGTPEAGEFVVDENRISKRFSLKDITKGGTLEDIVTATTAFSPAFGTHTHYCDGCESRGHSSSCKPNCTSSHSYCPGHPCTEGDWKDSGYSLIFEIATTPNTSVVAKNAGKYEFKYFNNDKDGDVDPLPILANVNSQQIAYRGDDKPSLAKYKSSLNGNAISDLAPLGITQANTVGSRASSSYKESTGTLGWRINLGSSDVELSKTCNATDTHTTKLTGSLDYSGTISVLQYLGKPNNGNEEVTKPNITSAKIGGVTVKNVSNAIDKRALISFNPYVRMLYDTRDGSNLPAYVLAHHKSTILPTDYMEMGWTNPLLESGKPSLVVSSKQWSTHRNATNGSEWRKPNRVLPGGAMYDVKVAPNGNTTVGIATYATYIIDDIINSTAEYNLGSLRFTPKAQAHSNMVNKLKSELDKTGLQMLVNKNYQANFDAAGSVEVKQGATVSLDTQKKLTNSPKYWLQLDNAKKATSSDFEIVNPKSSSRFYRVRSDVNGNVFIEKSTAHDGGFNVVQSFKKDDTAATIISSLNAEIKDIDTKTKLVTNFLHAIDRDGGNGNWYNEAWDGICVAVFEDTFEVSLGTGNAAVRKSIIDTKLTPVFTNQREMFTKAFSWGYRATNTPVGVLFGGNNIPLKNVTEIHKSDKNFIPNATVMDLD